MASLVLAAGAVTVAPAGVIACAWALTAATITVRDPDVPLGPLLAGIAALASVAIAVPALQSYAVAMLPAVALHVGAGLPDGRPRGRLRRVVVSAYVVAAGAGVLVSGRPDLASWVLAIEAVLAAAFAVGGWRSRYATADARGRRRMRWTLWGITAGAELAALAAIVSVLTHWPSEGASLAGVATLPVALALVLAEFPRLGPAPDALLVHTVALAPVPVLCAGVYAGVVLALGRLPTDAERAILAVSMLAAALGAVLYLPARQRLSFAAQRLLAAERLSPDALARTLQARLTRALPLDEILLQLAELLRASLQLSSAEVWLESGGDLELAAADPDRRLQKVALGPAEGALRAGPHIHGLPWVSVWLPEIVDGGSRDQPSRRQDDIRLMPITQSGELLGALVGRRRVGAEPFNSRDEDVLRQLARQTAPALHNARLDSALHASLVALAEQTRQLRASRARIVAAGDAERRRLERDLHDGAQQHLVGLSVNIRLARELAHTDPAAADELLAQLERATEQALVELRDLARGVYPPVLALQGIGPALRVAADRLRPSASVHVPAAGRQPADVEAAVYFCCVEALQNVAKHAGPDARVALTVGQEEGALVFEISDSGHGFDPDDAAVSGGLTGMRDRLGAVGGSLTVHSAPGAGTTVTGVVPLRSAPATDRTGSRAAP